MSRKISLAFSIGLYLAFLLFLAAPQSAVASPNRDSAATVPSINITPARGGPGTVVRISGAQFFMQDTIDIYISKQPCSEIKAPSRLIGTIHADKNGDWETTVTIPATYATGERIASGIVYIASPDIDCREFDFMPARLPATGENCSNTFSILAVISSCMVIAGTMLSATDKSIARGR